MLRICFANETKCILLTPESFTIVQEKYLTGFVKSFVKAGDIPDTLKNLKENRMATIFDVLQKHQDTKLFIDLSRFHTTAASNNNYGVFFRLCIGC